MQHRPHFRALPPDRINLFASFWHAAHWVWDRRKTAKRAGFPFSEETITETILLDIATQNPREIRILPLNKHLEGKIGADWEWCFYDRGRTSFVPMLVQAKVLDDKDRQYAHIDRTIGNTTVRQIDRLLLTAQDRGIPALYAFYNHLDNRTRVPMHTCSCCHCTECWGCSVASASAVQAVLPDKTFDTLCAISCPWACLLCPRETGPSDQINAPGRALAALRRLYVISQEVLRDRVVDLPPLPENPRREPPRYFEAFDVLERTEGTIERDRIVSEIAAGNPGIDGIVLVTDPPLPLRES